MITPCAQNRKNLIYFLSQTAFNKAVPFHKVLEIFATFFFSLTLEDGEEMLSREWSDKKEEELTTE